MLRVASAIAATIARRRVMPMVRRRIKSPVQ
jgi:hypothetical protein